MKRKIVWWNAVLGATVTLFGAIGFIGVATYGVQLLRAPVPKCQVGYVLMSSGSKAACVLGYEP